MTLKASLNLGLKGWLGEMFTDIKPVARPIVKLVDNLEPYWISGFITAVPEGEGVPFGVRDVSRGGYAS